MTTWHEILPKQQDTSSKGARRFVGWAPMWNRQGQPDAQTTFSAAPGVSSVAAFEIRCVSTELVVIWIVADPEAEAVGCT
jgi:hypothetical protein